MIRNLKKGEPLPPELTVGPRDKMDEDWVFVAEEDGRLVASLVCAPAHYMVIFLRLLCPPGCNPMTVRNLLVYTVKTIKERGYLGYTAWVDPTIQTENTLIAIIRAVGGTQLTNPQVVCAGRV